MLIAITSCGNGLESAFDERFGRAAFFVVYDTETKQIQVVDNNENVNAAQGAGIQSAQNIIKLGVQHLITGHCGPKAFPVLTAGGVSIYYSESATVKDALDAFIAGKLSKANIA